MPLIVLSLGSILIACWFSFYFTDQPLPGWDLPGHISLIDRLSQRIISGDLLAGMLGFYDRFWFSGWPAYTFYAPVTHLFAALLSIVLSFFYSDPSRAAVHYLLVFSCALLPYSFYFLASSFVPRGSVANHAKTLAAFGSVALSFWFLNHDHQWFGIGAASIMHIGLFSQGFAWHLLLVSVGLLLRESESKSCSWIVASAIAVALTLLSHTLTALFLFFIAALYFIWCREARRKIVTAYALGLGISSFWLLPFVSYSGRYVGLDIHRPSGDFLELFFRYPLHGLLKTVVTVLSGELPNIDPAQIGVAALFFYLTFSSPIRKNIRLQFAIISLLIGVLIFSSGYVASSITLGIHYYRFQAYIFILLSALLAALPMLDRSRKATSFFLGICYSAVLAGPFFFPHYERQQIIAGYKDDALAAEKQLLQYFKSIETKGRVFIDYNTDKRFPFLSPHYLASEIPRQTGFEMMNGLFIQSSTAYRIAAASANQLNAKTFNIPLLFTDRADLSDEAKLQQLMDLGITHIVAGASGFAGSVFNASEVVPIRISPYQIFDLSVRSKSQVYRLRKNLVGYLDLSGDMPFKFVQYYFHARQSIYEDFQIIDLPEVEQIPKGISLLIINSGSASQLEQFKKNYNGKERILALSFKDKYQLSHYSVQYQHNFELDEYNSIESYLDKINLPRKFELLANIQGVENEAEIPTLDWHDDQQGFTVSGLMPDVWYVANYSYFPYWQIQDGEIYRGGGERIIFRCAKESCEFNYQLFSSKAVVVGVVISVFSLLLLSILARRVD